MFLYGSAQNDNTLGLKTSHVIVVAPLGGIPPEIGDRSDIEHHGLELEDGVSGSSEYDSAVNRR